MGIVLLAVGISSRTSASSWKQLMEESLILNAANILIAAGAIVAVIGFLGCCGACKKNKCMLISFAVCIILIFILELAGGIYAYTKKDTLQQDVAKGLDQILDFYGNTTTADQKGFNDAVDWFQESVECCGTTGPKSWEKSKWTTKMGNKGTPDSCCIKIKKGCGKGDIKILVSKKTIYSKGCVEKGKEYAKNKIFLVGSVLIGIGVVQLMGILIACCLSRHAD